MLTTRAKANHRPDSFQQEAIACLDKGIRIVAPAGSGKTETLARRVAARIESGIDPRRILVLTFDNNARKSLEQYVRDAVPPRKSPVIRNLNQVGKDILRRYFPTEHQQIPPRQSNEMREMRSRFNSRSEELPVLQWDGVPRDVLEVFEALKNQGYQPGSVVDIEVQTRWLRREYLRLPDIDESATLDDFWGMPTGTIATDAYAGQIQRIIELYAEHDKYCRDRGIMSLTDQKSRAFFSLQKNRRIREELRASYDEVIVDECQDINRLDACLIWTLVGENTTLVLAGDDDQTLYEFRNAHSLYLREPERFFTDRAFTTIHLNINYRSPEVILAAANALIRHNIERIEKSPTSGVVHRGEICLLPSQSAIEEGRKLTQCIRRFLGQKLPGGSCASLRDMAVLCHDDATRKWVEGVLRSEKIPIFNDDRRSGPLVSEGLELLTFRKAKGRQWPIVFLPNSSDRVLPNDQSLREGLGESVRRMYYVAMTRASHTLVVSYVRAGEADVIHRTMSGEVVSTNGASRFLFEAGLVAQEPVEVPAVPAPTPSTNVDSTQRPVTGLTVLESQSDAVDGLRSETATAPDNERVQIIVQPVPNTESTPPLQKRRRATKPWELRQSELQSLQKAAVLWEQGDYEFAVLKAWTPVERLMNRVVMLPQGSDDKTMLRLISHALDMGIIEPRWADELHTWRKVRNQVVHEGGEVLTKSAVKKRDAYSLVQRAPDFLAYLAKRVAPKQVHLETHDEYLAKLTRLVERIESGLPLPRTGKPLKAIRFDPDREGLEMIPFQFLMILRDVRFYIPEEFRWSTAPVMGRFLVDMLGGMPAGVRPRGSHGTGKADKGDQDRIYWQLVRILENETRGDDARASLRGAVEDAVRFGNGNFHAGLKLNPRQTRR